MTSKERITIAMKGGTPDCVPVTLGLSEMVPVRYFTDDYVKFFWIEKIPLWKARVETESNRFGADSFLHLCENPSLSDPPVEITEVREKTGNVNSIHVMLNGKPKDVEKDIIRCMASAKAVGGYILGVGDQTPYHTPEENLHAFVEYGKKYGKY